MARSYLQASFETEKKGFCGWRHWFGVVSVCLFLAGCGADVEIVSNIPERDGNEVLSVLLNSGINARKVLNKEGLSTIFIDSSQISLAVDILRNHGLPREDFQGLGQVFRKDGMISSPMEEKSRLLFALSEELSQTLSRIDGVIFARVHLVLPDHDPFNDISVVSSAAVFIKYQKEYNLDILVPPIRKLVARSIPGLTEDRVSVILVPGQNYIRNELKKEEVNAVSRAPAPSSGSSMNTVFVFIAVAVFIVLMIGVAASYYMIWGKKVSASREKSDSKSGGQKGKNEG